MKQTTINISGRTFERAKEVARDFSYSRDHLTRLAREQKVYAVQVQKTWYVSRDSVAAYHESQEAEQLIRAKHASRERRAQLDYNAHAASSVVHWSLRFIELRAMVAVCGLLVCGWMFGGVLAMYVVDVPAVQQSAQVAESLEAAPTTESFAEPLLTTEITAMAEASEQWNTIISYE